MYIPEIDETYMSRKYKSRYKAISPGGSAKTEFKDSRLKAGRPEERTLSAVKHLQSYYDEFSFRYNTRFLNDAIRFKGAFKDINNRITLKG